MPASTNSTIGSSAYQPGPGTSLVNNHYRAHRRLASSQRAGGSDCSVLDETVIKMTAPASPISMNESKMSVLAMDNRCNAISGRTENRYD